MKRILTLSTLTLAALAAASCSHEATQDPTSPQLGSLDLALTVEGDYLIDVVELTVTAEDLGSSVARNRTINVSDPKATISALEGGLPEGNYTIGLTATIADDPATDFDESGIGCQGSVAGVEVVAGTTAETELVLVCTVDGGQVQVAGGLRVTAETALELTNQCPDLYSSAFIAPLDASVGAAVALGIEPIVGATVSWSATRGTVAADGSSFTCPDIPGEYTVTASVTTAEGCSQNFSETVSCHSTYEGSCESLPSAFAWEGDCGLRSPCHLLSQDGCSWVASCRGQIISGEGTGATSFPFAYSRGGTQLDCTADLIDGELTGTCNDDEASCSLKSNQNPAPSANCEHLLDLSNVTACGGTQASCDVIQEGCSYQAKCDDGTLRTGSVSGDTLTWDIDDRSTTGERYRCTAPIVNGEVTGSCARRDGDGPELCDDFSAQANTLDLGACAETLPVAGFKLAGCGLDGVHFAYQRGCVWEMVGQTDSVGGLATEDNTYEFVSPNGESCVGGVVAGKLVGSCGNGETACSFAAIDLNDDVSCVQLPDVITARGCGFGSPTPFDMVQDGCDFYTYAPSRGVFVTGEVTPSGIAFQGISPGWVCSADLNEEVGNELWGECTRANDDGSVSGCRDLGQDAPLVIGLSL